MWKSPAKLTDDRLTVSIKFTKHLLTHGSPNTRHVVTQLVSSDTTN